jgi:four helix bundle protein
MAAGSASEIDTQLELAVRLSYIERKLKEELAEEVETISKMLFGLIRSPRIRVGQPTTANRSPISVHQKG